MAAADDIFYQQLLETFRQEAEELAQTITEGLFALEREPTGPTAPATLETVYRSAHSLKGAARSVNLGIIEALCQPLEGVLADVKRGTPAITPELLDLFHQVVDLVREILTAPTPAAPGPHLTMMVMQMKQRLTTAASGTLTPAPPLKPRPDAASHLDALKEEPRESTPRNNDDPAPPPREAPSPETLSGFAVAPPVGAERHEVVRVSRDKLDRIVLRSEELVSLKLAMRQHAVAVRELAKFVAGVSRERVREGSHTGDTAWEELGARLRRNRRALEEDARLAAGMVDDLITETRMALMVTTGALVQLLHRLVRDLAREQAKSVELVSSGDLVEVDRRILQELKDPLIHLLRNSVDHGIESPAERLAAGKPERAVITLSFARTDDGRIEILVADDGRGIDLARLRDSLLRGGVLTADKSEEFPDEELIPYIFYSGVSTSRMITTLSGRGLGLAIVREKIEFLGGKVSVRTQAGLGATFQLLAPVSLATMRAIIVRAGRSRFAFPTVSVQRMILVRRRDVAPVEGRSTIIHDGKTAPVIPLALLLGLKEVSCAWDRDQYPAVVLGVEGERVACLVDEVLREDDILFKEFGRQLERVRHFAGVTVMGDGTIIPVLNIDDLFRTVHGQREWDIGPTADPAVSRVRRRILVVDDSITSRTLIRNVLDACGYHVVTACDGVDALALLQEEKIELVSSDVEMPRMNGFELTEAIRKDARLASLPVILVTGLESAEDKRRGMEVGADAYIVKSSFDQTNLIDIIERLLP